MIIVKYQSGRDKQGFAATTEQAEQGPSEPMRAWVMEPEWDRVSQSEYCMILLVELYLGESEG